VEENFTAFFDGFVKSSNFFVALHSSSLRSRQTTPQSSEFARLANFIEFGGTFFFAIRIWLFMSPPFLSFKQE